MPLLTTISETLIVLRCLLVHTDQSCSVCTLERIFRQNVTKRFALLPQGPSTGVVRCRRSSVRPSQTEAVVELENELTWNQIILREASDRSALQLHRT